MATLNGQDALQKHIDIVHALKTCACGLSIEAGLLSSHQESECHLRLTPCRHCLLNVTASELFSHEEYCGSKSTECEICKLQFPRKKMNNHLAVAHNINPSLLSSTSEVPTSSKKKKPTEETGEEAMKRALRESHLLNHQREHFCFLDFNFSSSREQDDRGRAARTCPRDV
jgi:hypothetical protein